MRQDADGFQGRSTSAEIHVIVGESRCACHVHPMSFAGHMQTRFILVDHFAADQSRFDLLFHCGQLPGAPLDQLPDGPFTHLDSQQVPHHLTRTRQGQQLLFDQVHGARSHVGSILDGGLHSGGKGSCGDLLAVGALFLFRPIFPHHQTRQRQIHDLTTLSSTHGHRLQILLAPLTPFYLPLDNLIWRGRELQARSRVSWLPPRFLLTLGAQAFRLASKTIRGGWQVAIVTVFREPLLQSFQLLAQPAHLLTVVLDQGVLLPEQLLLLLDEFVSLPQLFPQYLILFSQIVQFFFDRHALTLLGWTPLGKSLAHLGSYYQEKFSLMGKRRHI